MGYRVPAGSVGEIVAHAARSLEWLRSRGDSRALPALVGRAPFLGAKYDLALRLALAPAAPAGTDLPPAVRAQREVEAWARRALGARAKTLRSVLLPGVSPDGEGAGEGVSPKEEGVSSKEEGVSSKEEGVSSKGSSSGPTSNPSGSSADPSGNPSGNPSSTPSEPSVHPSVPSVPPSSTPCSVPTPGTGPSPWGPCGAWAVGSACPRAAWLLLLLDCAGENVSRLWDRGPAAQSAEAAAWRELWGARTELRRFKDGSIAYTTRAILANPLYCRLGLPPRRKPPRPRGDFEVRLRAPRARRRAAALPRRPPPAVDSPRNRPRPRRAGYPRGNAPT